MDHFEKVYDQLRREYLAGADARLAELRAEVESLRAGDREAASRLRARLHRLAGSGGSHGFPEISSAAREAEVMLRERGAGPADADALDDVVDRLAVAFSEAESSMRGGPPETGLPRLAVLVATDSADSVEWRESLARAGFGVRQVPAGAGPLTVGGGETAQLVVVAGTDESVYATTAAWAAAPAPAAGPRAVLIIEHGHPEGPAIDRLRAAEAGVAAVIRGSHAASELARFAQRFVRLVGRKQVMLIADEDADRAERLARSLGERGVEVSITGSVRSVGDHLDGEVPDLIVASATLPGGGGRTLCRVLAQIPRCAGLPTVILGELPPDESVAALRDGAEDVIPRLYDATAAAPGLAAILRARAERGRRIRELVHRDQLTGLLNRGAFVAEVEHAVGRARREGQPLALLFAELEHFRAINERHGLTMGDQVLAHVALVMRSTVRTSDPLARISGCTFGVILRGTGADGTSATAAKLERGLAEHPFETAEGGTIPVRARIGSAALGTDGTTSEELLHAAGVRLMQER